MIIIKIIIYLFLLFTSFTVNTVSATVKKCNFFDLNKQLNIFLKKQYPHTKDRIHILLRTPFKKKIYCKKPIFSLLNNFRALSLIDVLLTCNKQRYYLTVEIQAEGEYIAANRKIPKGTKIQESDLTILTGRLDKLPNDTFRDKNDVINRVNLRDFFPLQPITSLMTRPFWIVQINQQVTIIIHGDNFTISSQAKSLSNGAVNENIRVQTKTGKIINGIINQNGEIIVSL